MSPRWTFNPGDQVFVVGYEGTHKVVAELPKNTWDQRMFSVADEFGEEKTKPWYQLRHIDESKNKPLKPQP